MPSANSIERKHTLGIDIGGANLKYATSDGQAKSVEFPLWLRPDDLASQLRQDIDGFTGVDSVVATMTGELADCFLDREEGVRHIIDQLSRAASQSKKNAPRIFCMDGGFVETSQAVNQVDDAAASNWYALARFVGQEYSSRSNETMLLVDIGSTTTDLIPIRAGNVATGSRSDCERLAEHTLVYLGGGRTPICSFARSVCWGGRQVPVMREVFATIEDARVLLGYHPVDAADCRTSDGKPRDEFHCANRLARMIGLDHRGVSIDEARLIAAELHRQAKKLVEDAIKDVESNYDLGSNTTIVISGHCKDLLPEDVTSRSPIVLEERLGEDLSRVAPAFAIAKLFDGITASS